MLEDDQTRSCSGLWRTGGVVYYDWLWAIWISWDKPRPALNRYNQKS